MLGSGRPFVLEVINARAAVPPQSVFEAMQAALEQVLLHRNYHHLACALLGLHFLYPYSGIYDLLRLCTLLARLYSAEPLFFPQTLHCCDCQPAQIIALYCSTPDTGMHIQVQALAGSCLHNNNFPMQVYCNVQEDHGVQVQALQSVPRSICSLLKVSLPDPVIQLRVQHVLRMALTLHDVFHTFCTV